MKTMKKYTKMLTALVLALVMAAISPLNAYASSGTGKYVSDVYVAYGKNAEEAIKTLKDKGFTPVEGNLNDGGKTYVMMGYKTTDDIRDSITDLAVMNMRGDYSVEDYKTQLKAQKTEIAEFLTEFMTVIREYRANLKGEPERRIRRRVGEAAEMCQVADLMKKPIRTLSAGLKKRVALADAVLLRPRLLLLDDFLAGLDAGLRSASGAILSSVAAFSSVIVTGHELPDLAKWATRFLVLRDGVVASTVQAAGADAAALVARVEKEISGGAK